MKIFKKVILAVLIAVSMQVTVFGMEGTGIECRLLCKYDEYCPASTAFNSTGRLVAAAAYYSDKIKMWDILTGECEDVSLDLGAAGINSVCGIAFNSEGCLIACIAGPHVAKVWNASKGECVQTFDNEITVRSAVFNFAGDLVVVTSICDRTAMIWRLSTGECIKTLELDPGCVRAVAFNPTGDLMATGSDDSSAAVWDVATGRCRARLIGHEGPIQEVVFNASGDCVITASWDRTAKIWDVATGRCMATLVGHTGRLTSAAFNKAGDCIVTSSEDRTVRLWHDTMAFQINNEVRGEALQLMVACQNARCGVNSPARELNQSLVQEICGWLGRRPFDVNTAPAQVLSQD